MNCGKCDTEMFHANLTGNALYPIFLTNKKQGIFETEKRCDVACYVCPKCGYIELYAKNPQSIQID